MPVCLPRRTLAAEIVASLLLKLLALIAIGLLLFGPDDRPEPSPPPLLPGDRP